MKMKQSDKIEKRMRKTPKKLGGEIPWTHSSKTVLRPYCGPCNNGRAVNVSTSAVQSSKGPLGGLPGAPSLRSVNTMRVLSGDQLM